MHMDPAYVLKFPLLLFSLRYAAPLGFDRFLQVSQPVGHGRSFDGSRPGIIEVEYALQVGPFNVNVVSS